MDVYFGSRSDRLRDWPLPTGSSAARCSCTTFTRALGVMRNVSATLGVGGAIGMPVAAAVVDFADWRALFFGSAGEVGASGVRGTACPNE